MQAVSADSCLICRNDHFGGTTWAVDVFPGFLAVTARDAQNCMIWTVPLTWPGRKHADSESATSAVNIHSLIRAGWLRVPPVTSGRDACLRRAGSQL